MTKALFKTKLVQKFWAENASLLTIYYDAIVNFDLKRAIEKAKELEKQSESYIASTEDTFEDVFYNDMYIYSTFCKFLVSYANFWDNLLKGEYPETWDHLQDAIDHLRTLNVFSFINKTNVFYFFEKQLQAIEILYPYKIFASMEVIVDKIECSICGKNMNSFECSHIKGELYRGKLAYGIVREIKEYLGTSLVENPANKRCVMRSINDKPIPFPCVEYLAKIIEKKQYNPLMISNVVQTPRKEVVIDEKIPRNSQCPCGSGKKYKKCCLGKTIEKTHYEIILKEGQNAFTNEDLVAMVLIEKKEVA